MRAEGLEPPRLAPPAPKAGVSTSSTTPAAEVRCIPRGGSVRSPRHGAAEEHDDDLVIEHPNRDRASSKSTRVAVVLLLLVSRRPDARRDARRLARAAGLQGAARRLPARLPPVAYLVLRWNRGILPVIAALAIILRHLRGGRRPRAGSTATPPASPTRRSTPTCSGSSALLVRVQLLLIVFAMLGFRQAWNVEVERRVDGGQPPPPPPHRGAPLPRLAPRLYALPSAGPGGGIGRHGASKSPVREGMRVRVPPRVSRRSAPTARAPRPPSARGPASGPASAGRRGQHAGRQAAGRRQLVHLEPGRAAQQRAGGDVPRLDAALVVGVVAPGRRPGQVERRAAERGACRAPRGSTRATTRAWRSRTAGVVGEAGRRPARWPGRRAARAAQRRAVQRRRRRRATTGEQLAAQRVEDRRRAPRPRRRRSRTTAGSRRGS